MEVIKLEWIRAQRYCDLKGESLEAVHDRIKVGIWAAGIHFKRTGQRTLWINWENVNEWLQKQPHQESSLAA